MEGASLREPVRPAAEKLAPESGDGTSRRGKVLGKNCRTLTDPPGAVATYPLSPVLVSGGNGAPARWPALQFQAVKVKK